MVKTTFTPPEPALGTVTIEMDEKTARELYALIGNIGGLDFDAILRNSYGEARKALVDATRKTRGATPDFLAALWNSMDAELS